MRPNLTVRGKPLGPNQARVISNTNIAPRHYSMVIESHDIAAKAKAGQFVHVLTRDENNRDPFLRRAFSIMAVRDPQVDILFRVEGRGTAWLSEVQKGEVIDLLGPLGQPFDLEPFQTNRNLRPILVGGGVGVPPMVFLGQTLQQLRTKPLAIVGARSMPEVLCEAQFQSYGIECRVATEDGSYGRQGRVTSLLEDALKENPDSVVYSCGPWPMLRAVAAVAAEHGVKCQVSMEENMPCGIGVCNGCVVATKQEGEGSDFEKYRRVCIEGPAMWASEIDWGTA
ncbi:dihydroorotate dehydrogenase electron transfer subunit [bacterium]|nr:MAG: dihydroorotate dehydrogenase electron transfer subunit [bacterium]